MTEPTIKQEVVQNLDLFTEDATIWGELIKDGLEEPKGTNRPPDINIILPNEPPGLTWVESPEPTRPADKDLTFEDPEKPSNYNIKEIESFKDPGNIVEGVTFDWDTGTYEPGGKPVLPEYESPDIKLPVIQDFEGITSPPPVTLHEVTIPTFDGLTLPNFDITIDPANLPTLSNEFHYSEDPYSPEILDELLIEVRAILGGRLAVPSWVWDGFWSRAAGNLKRKEAADIFTARYGEAILGHTLPSMTKFVLLEDAYNRTDSAISELTRDNTLNQAVQAREDFFKAMEQGYAYEQLLVQTSHQRFERLLKAAIEANNSGIAVYNAALEGYKITVLQAKELLIKLKELALKGALAELDVFEAELKAAGFVLEYDKNQVELYKAQWSGEESKAKAYQAYVQGIQAYVESQKAAVDAFKSQVESNNTILQGWAIEWDAYVKRLEKSKLKIEAFNSRNSLFANRVQYFQAKGANEKSRIDSDIEIEKLHLASVANEIEVFKALYSGIQSKLDALTKIYLADVTAYSSLNSAKSSKTTALVNKYQADITKVNLDLTAKVESAKNVLSFYQADLDAWSKWQNNMASAYSQIASAAYSAANISLSAGSSVGYSYGTSYQESQAINHNTQIGASIQEASGISLDKPKIPSGHVVA